MTVSTACGRWPEELRFPPPVMKSKPFLCVQGATVSTRAARSSRPGSTGLGRGGSWLSRPARSASWSCRNQGAGVWGLVVGSGYRMQGGFDSGCSFLAARLNQLGERWKLVEPTCSLCELVVSKPRCGCLGTCGRVWLPDAGWFRHSRSLALTCWLNRLDVF